MKKHKTVFNWSGGKDSSLALHHLLHDEQYQVEQLLSTINQKYDRLSMHGVRRELIEKQAECIGIPLKLLLLPDQPDMEQYNELMWGHMNDLKKEGYTHTVFGDIFLEDFRSYREEKASVAGFEVVFPLWKRNTKELMLEFLDLGFKAISVCVNEKFLDKSFAGREVDNQFINDLPGAVDPCGENGEFHTFVFDGPVFNEAVPFEMGEKVYREYRQPGSANNNANNAPISHMGFWYCDLLPAG